MASETSILVIGPRWVGDMVMAQCLFAALREKYPGAAIDVFAPELMSELVDRMPEVRHLVEDPLPRGQLCIRQRRNIGRSLRGTYTDAYVLQGNWKSALIPWFADIPRRTGYRREMRYGLLNNMLRLEPGLKRQTAQIFHKLAGGGIFRSPELAVDVANQKRLLKQWDLNHDPFIALMPGAEFGPSKRWPVPSYAAFAQTMMARGYRIALLGSSRDNPDTVAIARLAPGVVDLAGQTSLGDAIDVLAAARLAVSNDSGLMHVAAAVGTPVVAIYGSTSGQHTPPLSDRSRLVTLGLECSPCHQRQCPLGHHDCMVRLEPTRVIRAADDLLTDPGQAL